MSRIRSVHPGFFNDEDIVSVSMLARLCLIGLGIEADDKGIFEWKPVRLRMRLFPADDVDMSIVLDELVGASLVRRFEIDGREYGAIRNFRKHQRPKTPNDIHPAPDDIRNYVGLSAAVSETGNGKRAPFPPKGEKSSQMEDGGGRMKDGIGEDADASFGNSVSDKPKSKPRAKLYAFEGKAFRLIQGDFDDWKALYHGIPDLAAELPNVDRWLVDHPKEGRNNFTTASGMLNKKHQQALTARQPSAPAAKDDPTFARYLRDEPTPEGEPA